MTTIDLVYFNAGGGHRAAALALQESLALRPARWRVRCLDLFELLDPLKQFQKIAGFAPEAYYNQRLARGWTLGLGQELKLLQGLLRLAHKEMVRRLQSHWLRTRPDIVVSLVPNFNLALHTSLVSAVPGVPFANVMTDMADHPPHFWMEAPRGQHIVCGTSQAVLQARALGHPESHIHRTSGMIIRPDFYSPLPVDRAAEFARLRLDPARPTGVVMFGGQGSMTMLNIARSLPDVQLILMCGRNDRLAASLAAEVGHAPRAIVGFTPEVRRHLQMADFFIGKPGPASLSEAVHLGLPVVTIKNAWTMPQERFNAHWISEQGLGIVASSTRRIRPAVLELLSRLVEFRRQVRQVQNNAVFEVPVILEKILDSADSSLDGAATMTTRGQFTSLV